MFTGLASNIIVNSNDRNNRMNPKCPNELSYPKNFNDPNNPKNSDLIPLRIIPTLIPPIPDNPRIILIIVVSLIALVPLLPVIPRVFPRVCHHNAVV